ncbi:UNVERIFIED_CONTAM: Semaphorin-3E [Gekko kuhli]
MIPDNEDQEDNKVYYFFTEKAVEVETGANAIYSRVGRVCANDMGGQRMRVNKWTTFLKTRLVCSVPGMNGIDTYFDELEDVFLLHTRENKNPVIFGLFSTTREKIIDLRQLHQPEKEELLPAALLCSH